MRAELVKLDDNGEETIAHTIERFAEGRARRGGLNLSAVRTILAASLSDVPFTLGYTVTESGCLLRVETASHGAGELRVPSPDPVLLDAHDALVRLAAIILAPTAEACTAAVHPHRYRRP